MEFELGIKVIYRNYYDPHRYYICQSQNEPIACMCHGTNIYVSIVKAGIKERINHHKLMLVHHAFVCNLQSGVRYEWDT